VLEVLEGGIGANAFRASLGRLENNLCQMDPQGEKNSLELRLIGWFQGRFRPHATLSHGSN
jgi:hypothetical protein